MSSSTRIYGCLFSIVMIVALLAGYIVASSLQAFSLDLPNPLARLDKPTATLGRIDARLVTPESDGDGSGTGAGGDAVADNTPELPVVPTQRPIPTVAVPTYEGSAPPATPVAGAATATPTAESTATPTATPTTPAYLFVQQGQVTARPERECYVGAVFGWVYDERGQPLPGVHLRVYDPWNNSFSTVSKQPPDAGYYDVIQGTKPATWHVLVVDAQGNQVSPTVVVEHKEGATACWYEVNFRRTR